MAKMTKKEIKSYYFWQMFGRAFAVFMLGLLLLLGVFLIFFYKAPFNPESDVCVEWSKCDEGYKFNDGICINGYVGYIPASIGIAGVYEGDPTAHGDKCVSWGEKTICETSPSDSSCVCDEYETSRVGTITITSPKYTISTDEKVIKDYVIVQQVQQTTFIDSEGDWEQNIEIKNQKTCIKSHKKTIYDFNCSELNRFIVFDECPNEIYNNFWNRGGCFPKVKKAFLDKGCLV